MLEIVVTERGIKAMRDPAFRVRLIGILEQLRDSGLIH